MMHAEFCINSDDNCEGNSLPVLFPCLWRLYKMYWWIVPNVWLIKSGLDFTDMFQPPVEHLVSDRCCSSFSQDEGDAKSK